MLMLVRNRVANYEVWKKHFDSQQPAANKAGLLLKNLWREVDDPNNVFFTLSVNDIEDAKAFLDNPNSEKAGDTAGVIDGEVHFVIEEK